MPPQVDRDPATRRGRPAEPADPELVAQRDRLVERFAHMQSELGGLFYEMAIRDHVRMEVLIPKAAELQRLDAELAQLERMIDSGKLERRRPLPGLRCALRPWRRVLRPVRASAHRLMLRRLRAHPPHLDAGRDRGRGLGAATAVIIAVAHPQQRVALLEPGGAAPAGGRSHHVLLDGDPADDDGRRRRHRRPRRPTRPMAHRASRAHRQSANPPADTGRGREQLHRQTTSPGVDTTDDSTTGTSGTGTTTSPTAQAEHVFVIALTTTSYRAAFGPGSVAHYLNHKLRRKKGVLLSGYRTLGGSELPDYLAMVSGQAPNADTRDRLRDYAEFSGSARRLRPTARCRGAGCVYPDTVLTLADQVTAAGKQWKAYLADMGDRPACTPTRTRPTTAPLPGAGSEYDTRHNPFIYFHSLLDLGGCQQQRRGRSRS